MVVISGVTHLSHSLCFLLQVAGGGSRPMMDYTNRIGSHIQKHPRPAMSCSPMVASKGVVAAVSANRLHSNALLSLCASRRMLHKLTNYVSQVHTNGLRICISTTTCALFALLRFHYCAIVSIWCLCCKTCGQFSYEHLVNIILIF